MNVSVAQAFQFCKDSPEHVILDVRTPTECIQGTPKGAICLELNDITDVALQKLSKQNSYYIICQTSQRSAIAIQQLKTLGFKNLYHINEGYQQWLVKKLPIDYPNLDKQDVRYQRQHQLHGFGRKAQDKLNNSRVLLIGAGGLGSSCAFYLAAAGIGQITIIDDDVVSLSNLQRQILHRTDSIGTLKVDSAHAQLSALNPEISINSISERINADNADELIKNTDVVIDGSDNLNTRYLVNDVCMKFQVPLVYAAVYQYEAQLSVFDFRNPGAACLRCLFPQTEGFEPENCSTVGVLGVVPGMAGVMQASEAIKLIAQVGEVLSNQLLVFDLLNNSFRTIKYTNDNNCSYHSPNS